MKYLFYPILLTLLFLNNCKNQEEVQCICGSGVLTSSIDNGIIEGELFLPNEDDEFPVVIIVPGSGLGTREEDLAFVEIFHSINYAVYLYDKRGIGGSTGSYPIETTDGTEFFQARADDVLAIINTLREHQNIDENRIALSGSSQGTWVNALVFNQSDDLHFMIMASGGAIPTGYEQFYDNLLLDNPELSVEDGHEQLTSYEGALGFDSRPIFESMNIPVLFILGGLDRSHPTLWEVEYIQSLEKENFEIHFYPTLNHDLEESTGQLGGQIIPDFLNWVNQL